MAELRFLGVRFLADPTTDLPSLFKGHHTVIGCTGFVTGSEPRIVDSIVYTAGDTVTYAQLADIVDSVLGRKVRRVEWSLPELRSELATDPGNAIKKYRVVFAEGKGVSWDRNETFNAQRRIGVLGVEAWAKKNLRD